MRAHLAALALLIPVLPAQDPRSPAEAWSDFLRESGPDWVAEWNPATGTPQSIWGKGIRLQAGRIESLDVARRHAEATLARYADLLGRADSRFVEHTAVTTPRVHVFVYDQFYRGLRVIDGRADVRINRAGMLASIGSRALPIPDRFVTVPVLGAAAARAAVRSELQLVVAPAPAGLADERVIWADAELRAPSPVRLAWQIAIDVAADNKAGRHVGRYYVDAQNGKILEYVSDLHECGFPGCRYASHDRHTSSPTPAPHPTPTASEDAADMVNVTGTVMMWTNTDVNPIGVMVNVPAENIRVELLGGNTAFTDANGNFTIPHAGTANVTLEVKLTGTRVAAVATAQGTALVTRIGATPGTPITIQLSVGNALPIDRAQTTAYYFANMINEFVRGYLGNVSQMDILDNVGVTTNINSVCNAYYTRNTINFFTAGAGCVNTAYNSVVIHEWGHGLDDVFGGINQTEGQSEGSADIVSIVFNDDPIVGHDFMGPGSVVRSGTNTTTYPSGVGVHAQGQPWMGFCWDVRLGLVQSLGQAPGLQALRQLFLGVFPTNPTSHPNAVLQVFLLDDDDGDLTNGTPNYNELSAAAIKRTIPYPRKGAGLYDVFGTACAGTGPTVCASNNPEGGPQSSITTNHQIAIQIKRSSPTTVLGFELFTSSTDTNNYAISTELYKSVGGFPEFGASSTGSMQITPGVRFYRTSLSPPIQLAANETFYIAWVPHPSMALPSVQFGNRGPYYSRFRTINWSGPFTQIPWAWKLVCDNGGGIPQLSATGVPEIRTSFSVDVASGKTNAPCVFFLGASNQTYQGIPLPFALGLVGAPGCDLLVAPDLIIPLQTDPTGSASMPISFPDNPWMLGKEFFNQFMIADPMANTLGFSFSNAGRGKIGKPM